MKKSLLVFLTLSLMIFAFSAVIAAEEVPTQIISFSPNPLLGSYDINYERVLTDKSSILVGGTILSMSAGDVEYSGFGVNAEYKLYQKEDAPEGLYFAPVGSFTSVKAKDALVDTTGTFFTAGGAAGYQWLFDNDLTANLEGSLQYISIKLEDDAFEIPFSGVIPFVRVSIGYKF